MLVFCTYWVASAVIAVEWRRDTPKIFQIGSGFQGSSFAKQLDTEITRGKEVMTLLNDKGNGFALAGDIADWISFGITSFIALIVGYHGKSYDGENIPELKMKNTKLRKTMKVLGFLGALAAVMTGVGSRLDSTATKAYEQCDGLYEHIKNARNSMTLVSESSEAQEIIEALKIQIDRRQ